MILFIRNRSITRLVPIHYIDQFDHYINYKDLSSVSSKDHCEIYSMRAIELQGGNQSRLEELREALGQAKGSLWSTVWGTGMI